MGKVIADLASSAASATFNVENATSSVDYVISGTDGSANQFLKTDGSGNLSWVANSSGKILQVLQATKTDTETTTSGTFVDITDLTVDITPAATSSKILIFANVLCIGTVAASAGWTRIARDGTGIAIADAAGSRERTSAMGYSPGDGDTRHHSTVWLDSPSTTSQITYSAQFMTAAGAGTAYINRFENNTDGTGYGRGVSSITVMEVGV